MQTLNLDDLAAAKRTVTLHGTEHEVREMSVEDFIAANVDAKALEAAGPQGVKENIEGTIVHLRRAIPTFEAGVLRKLSVPQLTALVQFVNGSLQAEAEKGTAAASKGADAGN